MVNKPGSSHYWSGLMKIKDLFFCFGSFQVNNGMQTKFWEDILLGDSPLKGQYLLLYNVVRRKDYTVANILRSDPLHISFRRPIIGPKLRNWNELIQRIATLQLSSQKDVFR